jgi:lactoylglutathione lyase
MTIKRLEHTGIMVKDIEVSINFYQDVLGLELQQAFTHTNGVLKLAFLKFPDSTHTDIELIEGYNDALPREGVVHHLAFTVDNLDAEIERFKNLNITFIEEEPTTLPNGLRYIFFHGPDGEWLELVQPAN